MTASDSTPASYRLFFYSPPTSHWFKIILCAKVHTELCTETHTTHHTTLHPKLHTKLHTNPCLPAAENGIFTSDTPSADWQTVHGLFPRGFNQLKIQNAYFPIIVKKTNAFVAEWSR